MRRWLGKWLGHEFQESEFQEGDFQDEMQADIDIETSEQISAGRSPQDARRAARLAFGNSSKIQEDVREIWRWVAVERLLQDLRVGIRALRRTPVWTVVVGAILILGIGMTTAIFRGLVPPLTCR